MSRDTDLVLAELGSARGAWVPTVPNIHDLCVLQYSRCINTIRRTQKVANYVEHMPNGKKWSWFRLVPDPAEPWPPPPGSHQFHPSKVTFGRLRPAPAVPVAHSQAPPIMTTSGPNGGGFLFDIAQEHRDE